MPDVPRDFRGAVLSATLAAPFAYFAATGIALGAVSPACTSGGDPDDDAEHSCAWSDGIGGAVALLGGLLVPPVVAGVGRLARGDGSFLVTLIGTIAGALATALTAWSLGEAGVLHDRDQLWIAGFALAPLPLVGAVLGYELTSDDARR